MFLLHFHLKEFYFENLLKGNDNEVFRDNLEMVLGPLFSSSIHKHALKWSRNLFRDACPILVQQCTINSLTEAFLPVFAFSYGNALIARPNI